MSNCPSRSRRMPSKPALTRMKSGLNRRALPRAGLRRAPRSRIRAVMVRAEVEDRIVVVEDVLRAVTVVVVEVDDEHAADAVDLLQIARGDRDVVEDAEAHAAVARRV